MYVVIAVISLFLGVLQLAAFTARRSDRWLGLWGVSNVFLGTGLLLIALQADAADVTAMSIANIIILVAYFLLVASVRVFARHHVNWTLYGGLAGAASIVLVLCFNGPSDFAARVGFGSSICAACDLAIALEGLRMARAEDLSSARVLAGLFFFSSVAFVIRTLLALTGHFGPSLFSTGADIRHWMAVIAGPIVALRGMALVLVAAERSHKAWENVALRDPLTGVINRKGLAFAFDRIAHQARRRKGLGVAVLLIDVDRFKVVNDTRGHAAGDDLLRLLVAAAYGVLRAGDTLARQGGDEFVVLLPGADAANALAIAERMRLAFQDLAAESHPDVKPTLSIGVAQDPSGNLSLGALLAQADGALYASKRAGRNAVAQFALQVP